MKQSLQHRLGRNTPLEEIERREKFGIALMRPTHAMVPARAEQSGIKHFADIVVGCGEGCEGAVFTVARKRRERNVFEGTFDLWSAPDGEPVAEDRGRGDPGGEAH